MDQVFCLSRNTHSGSCRRRRYRHYHCRWKRNFWEVPKLIGLIITPPQATNGRAEFLRVDEQWKYMHKLLWKSYTKFESSLEGMWTRNAHNFYGKRCVVFHNERYKNDQADLEQQSKRSSLCVQPARLQSAECKMRQKMQAATLIS